jgi:predicted GNAT family N-acyltransferase
VLVVVGAVRRATKGDAETASDILADGFGCDPVMQWLFADTISVVLKPFFHFMVSEAFIPLSATYLSVSCCAVWTPPGNDPWSREDLADRFLAAMQTVLTGEQFARLVTLNALVDQIHPEEPHWYLGMIATRTSAQGTGAGTQLLRHTLRQVDAQASPSYLESTNPMNIPFYERHGFEVFREAQLPDGPALTQMLRRARTATRRD